MKFVRGRASSHVLGCGILGCVSSVFCVEAFRENSWSKWRKNPVLSECLPLPPPLGCVEHSQAQEVMSQDETDFAWLTFIAALFLIAYVLSYLLIYVEHDLKSALIDELVSKRSQMFLIVSGATLNVLACVISAFRTNVITTITKRQSFFQYAGFTAVFSSSFYLVLGSVLCSLIATFLTHQLSEEKGSVSTPAHRIAKTIKQHMARNLMYPDDKRSTKMVTFSSMDREMEEVAAEIAVRAVMQYGLEEDVAEHVKQTFEAKYGPTWHCAVGTEFGSAVHHRSNEYIEVAMPQMSVLLFRCDEPRSQSQSTLMSSTSSLI